MNRPKRRAEKPSAQQKQKTNRRAASQSTKPQSRDTSRASSPAAQSTGSFDVEAFFASLDPVPATVPRLKRLNPLELKQLEEALEFGPKETWKDDWFGNLDFLEKEVTNPMTRGSKNKNNTTQSLLLWAEYEPANVGLVRSLVRHVCTNQNIPPSAKKILGSLTDKSSVDEIQQKVKRATHDPQVLREDGWTLDKSLKPVGASGGPFLIGDWILYDGNEAVIIAYIHDADIGDLWKALYVEDQTPFDMEIEEVMDSKRKYARRYEDKGKRSALSAGKKSEFTVPGIKYGIVLAGSYSKGARSGVYWPARIMHASEHAENAQSKRAASKQKVEVVFLAPYWKSDDFGSKPWKKIEGLVDGGDEGFETTPLLQVETIDANGEMIKEFQVQDDSDQLDYEAIQTAFRFTGLPGSSFVRYLDAYRLAVALRVYAKTYLGSYKYEDDSAANLFGTHVLSTETAKFPNVVLELPYWHILSQLRRSFNRSSIGGLAKSAEPSTEKIINIGQIVAVMQPNGRGASVPQSPPAANHQHGPTNADQRYDWTHTASCMNPAMLEHSESVSYLLSGFMSTFPALNAALNQKITPSLNGMINGFTTILIELAREDQIGPVQRRQRSAADQKARLNELIRSWIAVKNVGEDCLAMSRPASDLAIAEWRKACRRMYNFMLDLLTNAEGGKGFSGIVTDWRCNGHMTADGCFERMVRLPAAMKGVRQAISGEGKATCMVKEIPDEYLAFVEDDLLPKTHDPTYLERMKARCATVNNDEEVIMLTEDSDQEGGEDTMGSKGTWTAAVCAVASAVHAVDLVVKGECVNAFCATRPPGHHAGRRLHPMKAVSNGFCILNAVACAAIYAATPVADGGVGLRRVCIVDFDAHHGNGTQDILCSIYDPRFLYISIHAGGPEVNGTDFEGVGPKSTGIYPGSCGDTSPHAGVLNIPLGLQVTPHGVGMALLHRINPRVEQFCPDLIIVSAGFDAHKNDPMGLGNLRSADFFTITDSICTMARKHCNGRLVSVLEGGYGVPCCREQRNDLFLPASERDNDSMSQASSQTNGKTSKMEERKQPSALADLGPELPDDMEDQVPYPLQVRLDKCHEEGFVECVKEHVRALLKNNVPS